MSGAESEEAEYEVEAIRDYRSEGNFFFAFVPFLPIFLGTKIDAFFNCSKYHAIFEYFFEIISKIT